MTVWNSEGSQDWTWAWGRWPLRPLLTPRVYHLSKHECQGHSWHARATFSTLGSDSEQLCDLLLRTGPFLLPVSSTITRGSRIKWCRSSPRHICPPEASSWLQCVGKVEFELISAICWSPFAGRRLLKTKNHCWWWGYWTKVSIACWQESGWLWS